MPPDMPNHPNRGPKGPFLNPPPELIRELREQSLLTQAEFGDMLRASRRIVQDWEGGQRRMPPATAELMCISLAAHRLIAPGDWMAPWVRPELRRLV